MARARRLAIPSRAVLLDAAELIIGETSGLDPEQRALVTGRNRPALEPDNPKRRALDALPSVDVTAKYVALTIDCEQQKLIESVDLKTLTAAYAGVPLMQFRFSTCGRPAGPDVSQLRASDARWTDTLYWEGRRELVASLGQAIDFAKALGFFGQGREAFPSSLTLAMAWSNVNLSGRRIRRCAQRVRRCAGKVSDASRCVEWPDAVVELFAASRRGDRHRHEDARSRHVAHRRRQLLAGVEPLPDQAI